MKPVLFAPDADNFTTNGLGRLSDAISCTVHEARNGEYELSMTYPVSGAHFSEIKHSSIIVAKPSARRSNQAFRVYKVTKPLNGRVTILAQHISYQMSWIPVSPFTAANLTNAMKYLVSMSAEDNPFTFSADFTSDNDFAVPLPSSIRSTLGGKAGSILDIYGGEWEFDNYNAILHKARGVDHGYTIRYGKNLIDIKQEESILNTYTGIYPYWGSEGTTVMLPERVIHAATAANFPFQRTLVKDFSEKFDGMPTEKQLRDYTNSYIKANNIGVPSVSFTIDFVNLPDVDEYRDLIKEAENLDLCDTVTVEFSKFGISAKAKVVDIVWDVLNGRYESIQVGNSRSTLSGTIEETIRSVDVAATVSQVAQKIDRATGVLNAGTRGHIIINRNEAGFANEILALDNDNVAAAKNVLRINMNGIGFSSDGYRGHFYQAWTNDGVLSLGGIGNHYGQLHILDGNGKIIGIWANDGIHVNGGVLKIGEKFYVDKDGNLTATNGKFTGDISGSNITGSKITGSEIISKNKEFYVQENGDRVEVGFSGFDVWDKIMHTSWMGNVPNPATGSGSGGATAGISGRTGDAGFRKLYLLDNWYVGRDGSMWDVTRTIRWIDNRLKEIEEFCRSHDWSGDDDDDDPGEGDVDDGEYLEDGNI